MACLPTDLWNIVNDYLYHKKGQRVKFVYNEYQSWWENMRTMTGTIEQVLPCKDTYVIRCDDGSVSYFLISDGTGITSGTLTHLTFI